MKAISHESEAPPGSDDLQDLLQSGFRYALALTRQRESAEDVLHEACLSLARTGGPWQRRLLFRAIKHRFIDAYRRDQRRPAAHQAEFEIADDAVHAACETHSGRGDHSGGVLARLVQADAVEVALRCLSEDEREAVVLSWVEGYSARETAKQLGRPRGTILSLLHRAKQKLRERLADQAPATRRNPEPRKADR